MRHRTRDEKVAANPLRVEEWSQGTFSGARSVNPLSTMWTGTSADMYDVSTPNYITQVKNGGLIMHDVSLSREVRTGTRDWVGITPEVSVWRNQRRFSGNYAAYFMAGFPNGLPLDLGTAKANALIKAYAAMNSSSFMAPEFFKDFGTTVMMLRRPFSGLTSLVQKMYKARDKRLKRHRGIYTANQLHQAVSGAWLEYRYGMTPLLCDVVTIADGIYASTRPQRPPRRVVRASGGTVSKNAEYTGGVWSAVDYMFDPQATVSRSSERKVTAGVIFEVVETSQAARLAKWAGLSASDVPSTLWEFTPLSFVADWFINVGDWLKAITPNPAVNVVGNWITTTGYDSTIVSNVKWHTYHGWPSIRTDFSAPSASVKTFVYQRETNQVVSRLPLLLKQPLSVTHSVDAMALMAQGLSNLVKGLMNGNKLHL